MYLDNHRSAEKRDEKSREAKAKYEAQLSELKAELKSLKSARKEHARAMKKNVCSTSVVQSPFIVMYLMVEREKEGCEPDKYQYKSEGC